MSGPFGIKTVANRHHLRLIVTVYFWWENIKGVAESSEKALHIMKLVTVMVVLLIGWCIYTPCCAFAASALSISTQSHFSPGALRWLAHTALPPNWSGGHLYRAGTLRPGQSGEESLAQVYREIESPKLKNLKKAGLVIFVYSLVFTSLVSFSR